MVVRGEQNLSIVVDVMTQAPGKRPVQQCPICEDWFEPTRGGGQRCCGRSCARAYDWQTRKPKLVISAPNGYKWRYVENHPHRVRVNKKMRPEGGYILEHRWVMEQVLGRHLDPTERVHHKNGVRDDNKPGNLELWTVDHKDPPGIRQADCENFGVALQLLSAMSLAGARL